jgi:putative flippase GtrA
MDPRLREIATFGVIGVVATTTHAAIALFMNQHLGIAPFTANFLAYCCAFSVSYFGNARFTFGRPAFRGRQFLKFVSISLLGLALSQALTFLCTGVLGLPYTLALIPIVTLVPILSFVLSKAYAFAQEHDR